MPNEPMTLSEDQIETSYMSIVSRPSVPGALASPDPAPPEKDLDSSGDDSDGQEDTDAGPRYY